MNKLQQKTMFVFAAAAFVSVLSGCAPTTVMPQTHPYHLTSDTLPVCEPSQPLAQNAAGATTQQAIPVVAMKPQYPAQAVHHRLNGVVTLEFTIDTHGIPCDVALVYAAPAGLFVPVAVKALVKSTFKPMTVSGQPVPSRATFTYRFHISSVLRHRDQELHDVARSPTSPAYPMTAWLDHVEGFVTLGFTVDAEGHPKDIVVRQSEPAGSFDKAAARALRKSDFKIRYANGKAVPYDATFTYQFRLE